MVKKWGGNATWKLDKKNNPHEANFLKLDCSKAISKLGWKPKWKLNEVLSNIIDWHKSFLNGKDMREECLIEIKKYTN